MSSRTPTGQFVKGKTGNPLGRGARSKLIRSASGNRYLIDDLLMHEAPFVIAEVMQLIYAQDTPATAKVAAAKLLLEFALGKPKMTTVVKRADDDGDQLDLEVLDTDTIRAVASLTTKAEPNK